MNREHATRYARILVEHGVGLRPDQQLFVRSERVHRHLVLGIAEAAYDLGARRVDLWFSDPLEKALLVRRGRPEEIEACHERDRGWFNEVVRTRSPLILLVGEEFPQLPDQLARSHPQANAAFLRGARAARRVFLEHGIGRRICPWVLAAAPTARWARRVFPQLRAEQAETRLAELIFTFSCADRDDAAQVLAARVRRLEARARQLDALAITELRIRGGGSDLRVGLSARARWQSGAFETVRGHSFRGNLPSEEVFTTPDRRLTRGRLVASAPFRLADGVVVKNLVLSFRHGRVEAFDAGQGRQALARWLETDGGLRFLGEIALVGQDSPVARSGLFFDKLVLDENARSHVALGQGYALALAGGESLSAQELENLGCNLFGVHTDILFGSPEVSVVATRSRRGEVVVIDRGRWVEPF